MKLKSRLKLNYLKKTFKMRKNYMDLKEWIKQRNIFIKYLKDIKKTKEQ